MALISKMNRCAFCGSSEVVYSEATGLYHCPVCGKDIDPRDLVKDFYVGRILRETSEEEEVEMQPSGAWAVMEEKEEEKEPEEKEEKGTPDLEVKNNGIEIKMWMKCEEGSCVLDVERSGSYDSFNDLTDCETSVKVKCRNRTYSVPMPKSVDKTIFVSSIVSVSVATVCER